MSVGARTFFVCYGKNVGDMHFSDELVLEEDVADRHHEREVLNHLDHLVVERRSHHPGS